MHGYWAEYYERLADNMPSFAAEARDYEERLTRQSLLTADAHVLDFGCGFGLVAERLAPRVGHLYVWDASENMLSRARERLSKMRNVSILDPSRDTPARALDAIIVNSVIQYMSRDELAHTMTVWRRLLRTGGCVVVSDVIPPATSFVRDLTQTVHFVAKNGLLFRTLLRALGAVRDYAQVRHSAPLLTLTAADLSQLAERAGFRTELLPENLTFRQNRTTAVLVAGT